MENYTAPDALAEAVRTQFTALIDRLFSKKEVPDPLDQEAMDHKAHCREKLVAYVARPAHTADLDAFAKAKSTGRGIVLTGKSGARKTALLALWVQN